MVPTWLPKSTKIHEKSMPRYLPIMTSFFDRFLIEFWPQLRPPEPSKSLFFLGKNKVFSKQRLSKLGSIFDAILVPTWLHFAFPNQPKSFKNPTPRAIKILIDLCFDFFSILAPFWGPSWSHVGHLFPAKTAQDAPRTATRRPKTPPRHPKTPQDASRHP